MALRHVRYVFFTAAVLPLSVQAQQQPAQDAVCIAHGGAGGYAPFSSMSSFTLALSMKPDYIETDLQLSKDGVLVCIHDLSLEDQTDVEDLYPNRYTNVERNGQTLKRWYVNDFTLAELKALDSGSWFDPKFKGEPLATFQELIDLAKGKVGLYPETKDPDFYAARGLDINEALHELLKKNGLDTREGQKTTPVIIQSFYEQSLKRLRELGGDNYTLIQLVWFDQWNDCMTDKGLDRVATYANGVGPFLSMVLPPNESRIYEAHKRGLKVHVWKAHEAFPPARFPNRKSYMKYLLDDLHVDGIFTDRPDEFPAVEPAATSASRDEKSRT
ncbi:MAG: glycerophosphodiester phosphodiesterase family protein [Candidatus Hydrogenedentota bacterium]